MDKIIEQSRQELLIELDRRVEDGIIEKSNADLLKKLIQNAETLTEGTKERDALNTLFSGNRGNNTFKFFD